MNPCIQIYKIGGENIQYGTTPGTCRITGAKSHGILFSKWVKDTFNDWNSILPGSIISNEALFCFDEASEILKKKTGKDKLQRFRSYSHIIHNNEWFCLTKADKPQIFNLISNGASLVCLAESGQKHILFKHRPGFWQIENDFVYPDIDKFIVLHSHMCNLFAAGFSQQEIISGQYKNFRIIKAGHELWSHYENLINPFRGSALFDFCSFMIFA